MNFISVSPTEHSPRVEFNSNGKLLFEGRSILKNSIEFFKPLMDFVVKLKSETVVFNINLEYFNTATSKNLFEIIRCLDSNKHIQSFTIIWHFEEYDDASLEMAEIYAEFLSRGEMRYVAHHHLTQLYDFS